MYLRRAGRVRVTSCALAFVFLMPAALIVGCSALRVPEPPPDPEPLRPVWSPSELREHLRFLNSAEVAGRATGTQGFARAAAYVAARMDEFRLQPAIQDDYRIVYGASMNYPVSAALRSIGAADSLTFLPGIDFLPDARTDSGSVSASQFIIATSDVNPPTTGGGYGIVVPRGETVDLQAWRRAGAQLALVVGPLRPRFESAPVTGMVVVQLTPAALRTVLQVGGESLAGFLSDNRGELVSPGRTISAAVRTDYQPSAGAVNILGYYAGKHPEHQRELVVVCADLDAVGQFAGVRTVDFRNFGIATAGLLEVARNLGYVTRRWQLPERSVMMAVWSGSQLGHEGLRYFLEHPTWSIDRVTSVVYLGLDEDEAAEIRTMLGRYGIPLVVVPRAEEPLSPAEILLLPDPDVLRLARSRGTEAPRAEMPDMSQVVDSAVGRAMDLSREAYMHMMLQSTASGPFHPAREDTLAVPSASTE